MLSLEEALTALEQSPQLPSVDTFIHILQQCRKEQKVACSKRVHALIHNCGLEAHRALGNHLVPVLVECGSVSAAQQVFYRLTHRNEHSWTSLIQAFSQSEEFQHALSLFQRMQEDSTDATSYTFLAVLKVCKSLSTVERGQELHIEIAKEGFERDPYVGSTLVDMYAQFGSLAEAREVFDDLAVRDVVLWTLLITQYIEHGFPEEALNCLAEMQLHGVLMDAVTCVCSLKACGSIGAIGKGHEIHAVIAKEGFEGDPFVGNTLVDMYAKCGFFVEAWEVLDELPVRDVVSWNALIARYSEHELGEEVLMCLERMRLEGVSPNSVTFVCTLQAYGSMRDQEIVQATHMEIVKEGNERDSFIGNSLVDSYSKCGLLAEAQKVFEKIPVQDVVSWTALLAGFAEQGLCEKALDCLERMQLEDVSLDAVTLVCILKACSSIGALDRGQELHANITEEGFENDPVVGNTLVDMYAKCSSLAEAQGVFDDLQVRSVVSWNALLAGYADQGLGEEALDCLENLQMEGVSPNAVTYVCSLKGCGSIGALGRGQELHTEITKKGLESELLVGSTTVDLYAKCGALIEAHKVFDELAEQNVVSWAALLAGYVDHGLCVEALECIEQMRLDGVFPNAVTFICSLKACGKLRAIGKGQATHADIVREEFDRDQCVGITLVNMYAKCGAIVEAREMLDVLPTRDIVSWNALVTGYAEHGLNDELLECFIQMECEGVFPDAITFVCCVKACGRTGSLGCGQSLHSEIIKDGFEGDPSVGNALVEMYAKFGLFQDVEEVFGEFPVQNTVSWNVLLTGYDEHALGEEVLKCFEQMQLMGVSPNACTYACSLRACGRIGMVGRGQSLYAELVKEGYERDPSVVHTLVDMYAKCGSFGEAQDIFDEQPAQDTVLWNVLLAGYMKQGFGEEVFNILEKMHCQGVSSDVVTFICSVKACANIGAIEKGREIHASIAKDELERESIVGNTLVDMYAKCGFLIEAQEVFDDLLVQDVVSWSALISGYACQGDNVLVFHLFERMRKEGIQPDEVTFLRVLSACSHAGLVDRGQNYFEIISKECDIIIMVEHINCMMDLLTRAGQLDEAVAMLEKMPCLPDLVTWTTVLAACRKWGNLELGRQAFEGAARLDETHAASFILMSNIYAGAHT